MRIPNLLALVLGLAACEAGGTAAAPSLTREQGTTGPQAVHHPTNETKGAGECGAKKQAECGCGSEPVHNDRIEKTTDPKTGRSIQLVGAKLNGATAATVKQLLADPNKYAGQRVRVEGDISAMCHHKRSWFAVQDPGDRSGDYVRVMTAPAFLVPPRCIGRKARTEGTIEVIEVPATTRRHLAQEHDLANAQPNRRIVLRATGAEII